jgi:BirA family biotin operon repressor/biotin-[acetyl-CoA-carboxylase] ligase
MSVILRPDQFSADQIGEMTVLGALATLEGVQAIGAQALIKWPNDVLTQGAKLAGVLLESSWVEAQLDYMVMGIGINIGSASIEDRDRFDFPAACLEEQLGRPVERVEVIQKVLEALSIRCTQIGTGELMTAWDDYLAYKGQVVTVQGPQMNSTGKVVGINASGQLRLQLFTGEVLNIGVAGQHLRPVDRI